MLRTFVTFEADFPDDDVWNDDGFRVVPGGKAIALAIRDALSKRSFQCSGVRQHRFYGWAFDLAVNDTQFLCLIQVGDPWLMICEPQSSLFRRLFGRTADDESVVAVTVLHDVLAEDPRITAMQWFSREEYERGATKGTESPT